MLKSDIFISVRCKPISLIEKLRLVFIKAEKTRVYHHNPKKDYYILFKYLDNALYMTGREQLK